MQLNKYGDTYFNFRFHIIITSGVNFSNLMDFAISIIYRLKDLANIHSFIIINFKFVYYRTNFTFTNVLLIVKI